MTIMSQPSPPPEPTTLSPLADCLVALAGTPDDSSWIEPQFVALAGSATDLLPPVTAATVTACRAQLWTTVAHSSETVSALDTAQYLVEAGPTFVALDSGRPVAVDDIAAETRWPRFVDVAARLGLRTALCIPLFAGRGTTTAVLNLYGTDPAAMAPVATAVRNAYGRRQPVTLPDPGTAALIAGLAGAFGVRGRIRRAIEVVAADTHRTTDTAYLLLRVRAAETGASLLDTAATVLTEHRYATMTGM